jgi:hypothetical protein
VMMVCARFANVATGSNAGVRRTGDTVCRKVTCVTVSGSLFGMSLKITALPYPEAVS